MTEPSTAHPLFAPALLKPALADSLRRLRPEAQWRNPVMFVVWVGSVLTTVLGFVALKDHTGPTPGFVFAVAACLWLTVWFSNLAEALAEGRGKAQAAALRAAKHTPGGTPIEVRVRHEGGSVLIEVSDSGPGLPPVAVDKLFDPFERGRRESAVAGAGLGLALARRIVQAHGGKIEARQRHPHGAVFVLTLPASPPPEVESA